MFLFQKTWLEDLEAYIVDRIRVELAEGEESEREATLQMFCEIMLGCIRSPNVVANYGTPVVDQSPKLAEVVCQ